MFSTYIILLLFGLTGIGIAFGMFLRAKAKLDHTKKHTKYLKYSGIFFTLISLCALSALVFFYKNSILFIGLGICFAVTILVLFFLYFLLL